MDPTPGLIAVPLMKGYILLLTEREVTAGVERGKRWRRRQAMLRRIKPGPRKPPERPAVTA
jgi:hypothetical protein